MDIVTVADYRTFTDDCSTSDDVVSARLEVALDLVQDAIPGGRWLQLNTYTENLRVRNGLAYPTAVPVQSVVSPSGVSPYLMGEAIGIGAGWGWDPVVGPIDVTVTNQDVTYVGGFTHASLPVGLRLIICDVAYMMRNRSPSLTSAAVASASVGDVSVSYGSEGTGGAAIDAVLPGASRRLRAYRRGVA